MDAAAAAERMTRARAAHDALQDGHRAHLEKVRGNSPIDPAVLCAALGETLPENTVFVDETTTNRRVIQPYLNWTGPQSYYSVPSGLGQGLGYGLGVKLANPDRPVVSMIGDGAFLYNPVTQSLGLARDTGLATLMNNQLSYYPDGAGKQNEIYLGHPINAPDFAELVAPFGGYGRRVEDAADLAPALKEALAAVEDGKTALLNVVIG